MVKLKVIFYIIILIIILSGTTFLFDFDEYVEEDINLID